jgi:hypothetical protein
MSIGYTKLFSSIVTSTIWVESDRTRIVWITMLAMADRNGEIQASIPGLARLAGVPIPDCEEALAKFIAPDRYSRTPNDEGRRIEKIEGGWALLNHAKYREMASRDDSKAANTERQRRHREKEKRNGIVTPCNATVTPSNVKVTHPLHIAEAEAEAEAEARNTHTAPVPVAVGDEAPAADCPFPPEVARQQSARELEAESVWALYPKKKGKKEAMREVLNAIRTEGIERIRERVKAYADAVSRWPEDERKYVPDPVRWFKRGNYDDDPETWQRKSANGVPQLEARFDIF